MCSTFSEKQLLSLRFNIQGLSDRSRSMRSSATATVNRQIAFQAQHLAAARLGVGARNSGLTDYDVELARVAKKSIVRTWCMRGTLHLLDRADVGWIVSLIGPPIVRATRTRFAQLGLDEATRVRALSTIPELFADGVALTRKEVTRGMASHGVRLVGQATYHVLRLAALQGLLCMGPDRDGEPTFVLLESPLGGRAHQCRDQLVGRLIHRYLRAHAPAQLADVLAWSGLNAALVRPVWDRVSSKFAWITVKRESYAVLERQIYSPQDPDEDVHGVRLLPGFDAYILGYQQRDLVVPGEYAHRIQPGGGVMHPIVLVDGRAAGVWTFKPGRAGSRLRVKPFVRMEKSTLRALELEHQRFDRFRGTRTELEVQPPDV
jgi:hypothetical protein